MDDKLAAGLKAAISEDWQHDAVTYLEVAERAGAAMARAAGGDAGPGSAEHAEQAALFHTAYAQAQVCATLAAAAAVRELATEVDALRRQLS